MKYRLTKPTAGNKYYTTVQYGGYSRCMRVAMGGCDVIPNCVGYAVGRFSEIADYGECRYFNNSYTNAENFIQRKGNLKVSDKPAVGAIAVWQKGETLSPADGAGHLAVVEHIFDDNTMLTSESYYGGEAFKTVLRSNTNGRWGCGSEFKFLGFILNPAEPEERCIGTAVTTSPLNMRSMPDINGERITTTSANSKVNVFEIAGEWALVEWGRNFGWCNTAYLVMELFSDDDTETVSGLTTDDETETDEAPKENTEEAGQNETETPPADEKPAEESTLDNTVPSLIRILKKIFKILKKIWGDA